MTVLLDDDDDDDAATATSRPATSTPSPPPPAHSLRLRPQRSATGRPAIVDDDDEEEDETGADSTQTDTASSSATSSDDSDAAQPPARRRPGTNPPPNSKSGPAPHPLAPRPKKTPRKSPSSSPPKNRVAATARPVPLSALCDEPIDAACPAMWVEVFADLTPPPQPAAPAPPAAPSPSEDDLTPDIIPCFGAPPPPPPTAPPPPAAMPDAIRRWIGVDPCAKEAPAALLLDCSSDLGTPAMKAAMATTPSQHLDVTPPVPMPMPPLLRTPGGAPLDTHETYLLAIDGLSSLGEIRGQGGGDPWPGGWRSMARGVEIRGQGGGDPWPGGWRSMAQNRK
ncbi:hypothetical protein PAPYR_13265 [Paratrimastix pyriformis]|uniref:Uncharacterized protein n=1 Tax=Paratrimastix pyriformis TaxID=342808 RepID=A0ABQ8U209_9EUKA|nr:hypothetical protein PAPYR_13265 [Paratrimastix pyriformis]